MGEAYRASILLLHRDFAAVFYEPRRSRTFPWYLALFRIALEQSLRTLKPCSQVQVDDEMARLAREVLGIVRELGSDFAIIPRAEESARLLCGALRSKARYEVVAHSVIADVAKHLKNAEDAVTIKGGRRVHKLPRRSPRHRSLFPDPEQPAWAAVNRMPSRKVQMPCRVGPDIKALIENESQAANISQSRWLEEAIAEKLQRQGHPVYLAEPVMVPEDRPAPPRRARRASLPEPDKSPDSAANRAEKVTTVRISTQLAKHIDKQRGRKDRSSWLNKAARAFMETKADLPEPLPAPEALPIALSLRFDRRFFLEMDAAVERSGLTRSERLRRVSRWYLVISQ